MKIFIFFGWDDKLGANASDLKSDKIFLMFEFGLSMIFFMIESATQVSDLCPILHVL